MNFELKGKVEAVLDAQSGTSKTGNEWKKQSFVIETSGQYPKKVYFTLWGDKTSMLENLAVGAEAEVQFRVESREYNGRWYTDLTASDIKVEGGTADAPPASDAPPMEAPENVDEEMPF
ncbi:MAG: DUF3127 domain-containing protein [Planctomycetes bacterium]|nr:DUF3127 domain-containing protein [Planctomycetota bacterium]